MPQKKPRSNKIDLGKGLWLKTEEGNYIALEKKALTAENIRPEPVIRYGKAPPEDPKKPIELVENASWPVFRDNTVSRIVQLFQENGFTPKSLYKDAPDDVAASKFTTLMSSTVQLLMGLPLQTYTKGYIDRKEAKVQSSDVWKYKVVSVNEATGREELEEFPYLEMTHMIEEKDSLGYCVWPRIYFDLWVPDTYHQLTAKDDAGRFELWRLAQKLNAYPFPVKDEKGEIKRDDNGDPIMQFEEAMLVKQGYVAQSGSTKQYHALIVPERMQIGSEEKFVFLMKLTRTIRKYAEPMKVPAPGETPVSVLKDQKPLVMESFAEMLKLAAA